MRQVLFGSMTVFLAIIPISAFGQPTAATDVTKKEIETVLASMDGGIDRQIKVIDIGDANLAVGVLHRSGTEPDGSTAVRGLVHNRVTEVYYVLSGGGTLVTGGDTRQISAGDVVVIPAGVFHAWSHIPDHVTYLSIRPDLDRLLPTGYINPALEQ